jgi:Zn-dependent protease
MADLSRFLPSWTNLLILPGIIAGFTVHELGHTLVAYLLGDLSQVKRGRITLNPFRHISWFGTMTFVLFGFGWARSAQVDPSHFKRRYLGTFLVAIAGATANLLLAGCILALTLVLVSLVAIISRQDPSDIMSLLINAESATTADIISWTAAFTTYAIYANLALAFFNLLPFPTLDGFTALISLLGMLRDDDDQQVPITDSPPVTHTEPSTAPEPPRQHRPADIHFNLGAEYHAEGKHEDAIARYRQAIASDRNYGPAYVNMGLAYLALNKRARAIQAFRGATRYATDEDSRREAWAQLHKLSESPPLTDRSSSPPMPTEFPPASIPETGPWTNASPNPNWLAFGVSSLLTITASGCLYTYLAIELIRYLS